MNKIRVGILFGGRSGAHEVSLLSATSVINAIDKQKYEVVPIGISKEGRWLVAGHAERMLKGNNTGQQLRAGDPGATPGAAVLARGEQIVVPQVTVRAGGSLQPFKLDGNSAHLESSLRYHTIN